MYYPPKFLPFIKQNHRLQSHRVDSKTVKEIEHIVCHGEYQMDLNLNLVCVKTFNGV